MQAWHPHKKTLLPVAEGFVLVAPTGLTCPAGSLSFITQPKYKPFPLRGYTGFSFRLLMQAWHPHKKTLLPVAEGFVLVAPTGLEPVSTV